MRSFFATPMFSRRRCGVQGQWLVFQNMRLKLGEINSYYLSVILNIQHRCYQIYNIHKWETLCDIFCLFYNRCTMLKLRSLVCQSSGCARGASVAVCHCFSSVSGATTTSMQHLYRYLAWVKCSNSYIRCNGLEGLICRTEKRKREKDRVSV